MKVVILEWFILLLIISSLTATLGPGDKKKKKEKPIETNQSELKNKKSQIDDNDSSAVDVDYNKFDDVSVVDRGLVKKSIKSIEELIDNYSKYCQTCSKEKYFENKVLGYVTPWNSKGYDIAKTFSNKLDYISPVWLQIRRIGRKKYELTGKHDIDTNWIQTVKQLNTNGGSKFVPRILFEKLTENDIHALFNDEDEKESLAKMLVAETKRNKFDGYVLEIYSQMGNGYNNIHINHLVQDIANILHENNKIIIIVIPPPISGNNINENVNKNSILFSKDDFYDLKDVVDGIWFLIQK
jgi:chitinase domain-containing protein 1